MRVFACALPALLLFPVPDASAARPAPAVAAFPAARIIYTADTLGFLHPCVSCGGASQGGLARRVALLPKLAAETAQPLIIAGPDEFYADRESPAPGHAARVAPVLLTAFSRMPYTAIYLSPPAARDLQAHALATPPNAVAVADAPVTRMFRAGNLTAACVFLPAGNGAPDQDQVLAAQVAAKEAAKGADIVIGISPWGMRAENSLAPSFAGYFHIILGGGHGIAVPGQASGDPATPGPLWVRSDRQGRACNVLDIFTAPGTPWLDGVHFTSRLEFLAPDLPEDPAIRELASDLKDNE